MLSIRASCSGLESKRAEVGQLAHAEAMALLGHFAQHVLRLQLPGDAAAAADGSGGVADASVEANSRGVLALLGEPTKPLPGQGDGLRYEVGLLEPALDMAEVDAGVGFDPSRI